jgi:hypothetical protein
MDLNKYYPPKWQTKEDRNTIGWCLWRALMGEPDLYHHEKYGEHVSTWDEVM